MGNSLMFALFRSAFVAVLLLFSLQLIVLGDDAKAPPIDSGLVAADKLCRLGRFAEAEASYQELLKTDSKLVPAQVGVVRAMLGQQKIDEALDTVNTALAAEPDSATLLALKGDVQYRRGEMSDAELSYLAAQKHDPKEVRAHLGLALLYRSYSLYRKAYDQLQITREIAPDDFTVQVAWVSMLPQKQRLAAMQSFLDSPHPDHEEETRSMTTYLEFLKTTTDQSPHACRLVSKVDQTATKLQVVYFPNSHRMRGIGVSTQINDQKTLLQLDTGATGIILDSSVAEKAGLKAISGVYLRGVGDHGPQSGYRAVADHIRIGELEFQDCVVRVTNRPGLDELIGADVFGSYLVELDLPEMNLKLSPLPKRPEDAVAPTSLSSEAEETQQDESERTSTERLPRDRYVAPEMANWTQVFRFGHMILVPTKVNESKPMLFLLDTGSPGNVLSVRVGREVSRVRSENRVRIAGLSGNVNKVYTSAEATLRFGHLEQRVKNIATFDFPAVAQTGTEVSGLLGFAMLRLLQVKLDYRDGLVDFEYNPKHRK